jgi:hypothetical protein
VSLNAWRAPQESSPGLVTKHLVNQFVEDMIERGLATDTINDRLRKVKAIYRVAVGKLGGVNYLDRSTTTILAG